jgi:DNA-binding transcriptional MerR regulator
MLTISQLAGYAGVTVRAVRHYHNIGLLPEPERNRSGYRAYDASAVVRLIRIHTLAGSGVPLARVQELLDASPEAFTDAIEEIDKELRGEIRRLQRSRRRLAELAAGGHPALPTSVVGYLDRLRQLGVDDRYIDLEGDAWIMVAAQMPDQIDAVIAGKHAELDDPETVRLYRLLSEAVDWSADDPRVVELADCLERLLVRAVEAGETGDLGLDNQFVDLLDASAVETSPVARRLRSILEERGWDGWIRVQRASPPDEPLRLG